ncbi:phage tail protein [Phormidesmis sp. 146-33]
MTQAISKTILQVQMTSMAPLEKVEAVAILGQETTQIATNSLLLHPGEPGEIVVRVENPGDRVLQWRLNLGGEVPSEWHSEEQPLRELAPQAKEDVSLVFTAPLDFFEHQTALEQGTQLQLTYQCEIEVSEVREAGARSISYRVFTLYVRPRVSYLDFLPAFYAETDFFERFLAIIEQTFDPYVQTIDTLWAYLDPLTAPESMLPFLAHWVAWKLEPDWDIEQQRRLIRDAIELYRWHGTRRGLQRYLSLYTNLPCKDEYVAIEEAFTGGFTFGSCQLGQNAMMGGGRPFHFMVRLRPEHPDQIIDESLVRMVIEREKPPFCTYDLSIEHQ